MALRRIVPKGQYCITIGGCQTTDNHKLLFMSGEASVNKNNFKGQTSLEGKHLMNAPFGALKLL